MAEQLTLNQWVLGSSPRGRTSKKDPADSSESAGFLRSPRKRLEKLGGIDISPCSGVRCLEDGIRPRSYRGGVGTSHLPRLRGALHVSSAPTQGHPSPGRSALSLLRCGERPCDTLRALPENVAAPRGSRWARLYATWRVRGGFGGLRSDIRVPEAKRGRVPL